MYSHIISLGENCSIATELERLGLRDTSGPFDWMTTSLDGILQLIEKNFEDFLKEELLFQYRNNNGVYKNIKYNCDFRHDFSGNIPFGIQIGDVQQKYNRRISRFMKNIYEPTLFIRIVSDEKECEYINENHEEIVAFFRKYNSHNNIMFLHHEKNELDARVESYCVDTEFASKPDMNGLFETNQNLLKTILNRNLYDSCKKRENLEIYENRKNKKPKRDFKIYIKKIWCLFSKKPYHKLYAHKQQLDELDSRNVK